MVTHSSTSRPVQCLCMAERTGCPVLTDIWSYVFYQDDTKFILFAIANFHCLVGKQSGKMVSLKVWRSARRHGIDAWGVMCEAKRRDVRPKSSCNRAHSALVPAKPQLTVVCCVCTSPLTYLLHNFPRVLKFIIVVELDQRPGTLD